MNKVRLTGILVVMVIFGLLNGCLISHHSHTTASSPYCTISKQDLDSVEPGITTKDWIIDTFGKPGRAKYLQDGEEVLIYGSKKRISHDFKIFLIFKTRSSEEIKETLTFRIKDGIVKSYWFS